MHTNYESPLSSRYADEEMKYLFSEEKKFRTWRKLWIALAQAEHELGLPVTQEQIDELTAYQDDINYEVARAREKEVRHDVMSHVYAYGVQCPKAKPIIHLGATSCYVGDNTDIIIMTEALHLVKKKLVLVVRALSRFAEQHKDQPTLAYAHAPAKEISVFDYTQVLFSAILGFFLFGQVPDGWSVVGYVVICGASVYFGTFL